MKCINARNYPTIGQLLKKKRRSQQITRWELANMFNRHIDPNKNVDSDWILNLENDRLGVQQPEFDWLIPVMLKVFGDKFEQEYLELIRSQSKLE